jgi:hypothetical protein
MPNTTVQAVAEGLPINKFDLEDDILAIERYAQAIHLIALSDDVFNDSAVSPALYQLGEDIEERCKRLWAQLWPNDAVREAVS